MPTEQVTDVRECPTCGHIHPNGIGAAWCSCEDCSLLWSPVPREAMVEEYRARLDELRRQQGQP